MSREAYSVRNTKETRIEAKLNLDGNRNIDVHTGIGFFDHMLTLLAYHANMDLYIKADGDLDVDCHHTIEDCGIVLGKLFNEAIGDKKGIERYGSVNQIMDEVMCLVSLDFSGRPYLVYNCNHTREKVGDMACEMVYEFFYALAMHANITLHINMLYGNNEHHKIEAIFKGVGRSMKQAIKITSDEVISSKGMLE